MSTLKDLMSAQPELYLPLGGLIIGALFGAITQQTNFCTMGALSDASTFGDWRRFRAWILAIAVSIAGTQLLAAAGIVDLTKSMYLGATLGWAGNLLGGLMMGFGMVFAGGCPSRNLARAGSGDLRALMILVIVGIFAFMTIGGVIGPVRAAIDNATSINLGAIKAADQGLASVLAAITGSPALAKPLAFGALVAAGLAAWCFADAGFRNSRRHVLSGLGIGLTVVAGWALSGLAFDDMAAKPVAPVSLTFVRPSGDTLEWLQRFTALGAPGFGVASLFGAIFGAFVAAWAGGTLKLQTFADAGDTVRSLGGAALMGVGGVLALGCTVGQGITGLSTLALGAIITFGAIVAGGFRALKMLERML
jgi:uncharacterized membrane protein YedE/YeeE